MGVFKIKGVVQNYAWGGTDYIPDLIGQTKSGDKCAEYWMGAHDKAPSTVVGTGLRLDDVINKNPNEMLGEQVVKRFGLLPYLFKVLDVVDILSIQVHPSKVEAEKGFARENAEGIPLSAAYRNYKDDNHKPEIMVALGDFWLLHGFLPEVKLIKMLRNTPELSQLLPVFEQQSYRGLYQLVMEESKEKTNDVLRPLIERVLPLYQSGALDKSSPEYWAAKAFLTFCPQGDLDKGIYSIFFFNIVQVNAGEAVFQDAGVPHAYMEGQNMELMANSDNVLRGGLTPKHVDVDELLKHVSFTETIPNILSGEIQPDGIERIYKSPAPDFELSKLDLNHSSNYQIKSSTFEIMIVLDGEVKVTNGEESIVAGKGEVFAVTANTSYQILSEKSAQLYKAKCPS
jgi:mannose-6-phosphate isomerase